MEWRFQMEMHHASSYKNRLQHETSPYLLQHAGNPVDWYPWGDEAFALAQKEDKPILLSIGYSACHWCHVMARESFADPKTAELMNRVFVNIKVDREERPDIDKLFMLVCQMMTGRGGWPLTIIMTPDKKPLFAATYLPPTNRRGMLGLREMSLKIREIWELQPDKVFESAEQITASIRQAVKNNLQSEFVLTPELSLKAFSELKNSYDKANGGFGRAPKFPSAHNLFFLLRHWQKTGDREVLQMVEQTLEQMQAGGIFDQLGFGFHRYSTDPTWLVPHFEKMLYDQALLTLVYTDAFLACKRGDFRRTAEQTLSYVLGVLADRGGAFFSAQDADSEGEEGKYYLWNTTEILETLGPELGPFATKLFSMTEEGNFAEESTGQRNGANILHRKKALHEVAAQLHLEMNQAQEKAEQIRVRLEKTRQRRTAPPLDDKILVDWNGLMIVSLARAGRAFDNPNYTRSAVGAADFLWKHCRPEGKLCHSYCKGRTSGAGFLDDYAFFAWGLYELYETTFKEEYLAKAKQLVDLMIKLFRDERQGGLFYSAPEGDDLFITPKETMDGAYPSGSSVALLLLNRLASLSNEKNYEDRAGELSSSLGKAAGQAPMAHLATLYFLDISSLENPRIVLCGRREQTLQSRMLSDLRSGFHPEVAVYLNTDKAETLLSKIAPLTAHYTAINVTPTAYLCTGRQCSQPVTESQGLLRLLGTSQAMS
jgi:uncharacterized protein YyaL (SSP411 family)